MFFYTEEMLKPDPYLSDIKIIEDKNDFLKNLKVKSQGLYFSMEPMALDFYVDKFIATSHECYRRVHTQMNSY